MLTEVCSTNKETIHSLSPAFTNMEVKDDVRLSQSDESALVGRI